MRAKLFLISLAVIILSSIHLAEAQQVGKVYRIGYLSPVDPVTESTRAEAIRWALRELGYVEGDNITTEYR